MASSGQGGPFRNCPSRQEGSGEGLFRPPDARGGPLSPASGSRPDRRAGDRRHPRSARPADRRRCRCRRTADRHPPSAAASTASRRRHTGRRCRDAGRRRRARATTRSRIRRATCGAAKTSSSIARHAADHDVVMTSRTGRFVACACVNVSVVQVRQSIDCGAGTSCAGKYTGSGGTLHRMTVGHGYNESKSWLIG